MAECIDQIVATEMEDVDPKLVTVGEKSTRSWDFKDKEQKPISGSQTTCPPYYNGKKFFVSLSNLKSNSGIWQPKDGKGKFGAVSVVFATDADKNNELVKKMLDVPIRAALWEKRATYLPRKCTSEVMLEALYNGLLTQGRAKKDGSGYYPDSIMLSVPWKKGAPDSELCIIEDEGGKPWSWMTLAGKTLSEVVIELEAVVLSDKECKLKAVLRVLTVAGAVPPKITSKRKAETDKIRMDQAENAKKAKIVPSGSVPSGPPPPLNNVPPSSSLPVPLPIVTNGTNGANGSTADKTTVKVKA